MVCIGRSRNVGGFCCVLQYGDVPLCVGPVATIAILGSLLGLQAASVSADVHSIRRTCTAWCSQSYMEFIVGRNTCLSDGGCVVALALYCIE